MNRQQFMEQLKMRLKRLPYDEIKVAVDYYEEYFDEAGEEAALKELGSPADVASRIISEFAMKDPVETDSLVEKPKKRISKLWVVILAIFASPIAIPLGLAFVIIVFALLLIIYSVILSFGIVGVALGICGVGSIIGTLFLIKPDFGTTLFFIGVGLVSLGLCAYMVKFTIWSCVASFAKLTKVSAKFLRRGGNTNTQ